MPTYQYKCEACKYIFEEFQLISDDPLEKCPKCGGKVHRLISGGAGFLFKGSGFYITDYRSDGYKKAAEKEKSETTLKTSAGTAANSTESKKPAEKSQAAKIKDHK
jgi:putative FmdB family regulatory protein